MPSKTQTLSPFGVLNPAKKAPSSFVSLNIPVKESNIEPAVNDDSSNGSQITDEEINQS